MKVMPRITKENHKTGYKGHFSRKLSSLSPCFALIHVTLSFQGCLSTKLSHITLHVRVLMVNGDPVIKSIFVPIIWINLNILQTQKIISTQKIGSNRQICYARQSQDSGLLELASLLESSVRHLSYLLAISRINMAESGSSSELCSQKSSPVTLSLPLKAQICYTLECSLWDQVILVDSSYHSHIQTNS